MKTLDEITKSKYHMNDIISFLFRKNYADDIQSWKTVSNINNQIRKNVHVWIKKKKKKEIKLNKMNSKVHISNIVWWNQHSRFSTANYENEAQ